MTTPTRAQRGPRLRRSLVELGERQINAIARNYYLSSAMYLMRDLPPQ
ncbi:MAG TPA: hypothetical protein VLK65_03385 [Vicinamibacteria bacterium]|nr:hypothetical protein [Vicinamibacteria bacterium]